MTEKTNQAEIRELVRRRIRLESIITEVEKRLKSAPEGYVHIIRHGNKKQFYHRTDPKDNNGVYMPVSEHEKAKALVQKKYDQEVLKYARQQVEVIDHFLQKYDPDILKAVFENMGELRKEFILPIEMPDDMFAAMWQNQEYEHKGFIDGAAEHYTMKNERVRSKSEVMIANELVYYGFLYHYEFPLVILGHTIHPDFTILRMSDRKTIYWEHFGMMDDPEYRNSALSRIREYEEAGIFPGDRLIITMETLKMPLNRTQIRRVINHYLIQV